MSDGLTQVLETLRRGDPVALIAPNWDVARGLVAAVQQRAMAVGSPSVWREDLGTLRTGDGGALRVLTEDRLEPLHLRGLHFELVWIPLGLSTDADTALVRLVDDASHLVEGP